MPPVFIMTELTGVKSNDDRPVIFSGFEIQYRHFWIAAIAFVPSVLVVMIFWGLFGTYSILALPIIEGAAFFLFERRSREGLELRTWKAMRDKRRGKVSSLFMCGEPITILQDGTQNLSVSSLPVRQDDRTERLLNDFGGYGIDTRERLNPSPIAPV